MGKLAKLLLSLLVLVLILIVIAYFSLMIFVNTQGKGFIQSYLADRYETQAQIKSIRLSFPFTLVINEFSCGDISFSKAYLKLEKIKLDPVTPIFSKFQVDDFKAQVVRQRSEVTIDPFWRYRITTSKNAPLLDHVDTNTNIDLKSPLTDSIPSQNKLPFSFIIKEILLKDIAVTYTDYTFVPPLTFTLKDTDVKLRDFNLPKLLMFYFTISASLETETKNMPEILKADGWIDWFYKNMEAHLIVDRYDYLTFDKQYPRDFKASELNLKQAFISLLLDLEADNNDLGISGDVIFKDVMFEDNPVNPEKVGSLKNALAALKKKDNDPYFTLPKLRTKLDRPSIDMNQVFGHLQQITIRNVEGVINRVLSGETDINNIEDDPAVKTMKDIFRGVESLMKDKFKSKE